MLRFMRRFVWCAALSTALAFTMPAAAVRAEDLGQEAAETQQQQQAELDQKRQDYTEYWQEVQAQQEAQQAQPQSQQ
jgi:hypothetical protein